MGFLEKLNQLLIENNETRNGLAKKIEISESTIRAWYQGKVPALDKVVKISQYFAISLDELVLDVKTDLTENEKELLQQFKKLPEREQIKFIARIEDVAEKYTEHEPLSSTSKIG